MKNFVASLCRQSLSTLFVAALFVGSSSPAAVTTTPIITATLTITNLPLGGGPTNLTVNGQLRVWTNVQTSTSFLTNLAGINAAKTNLYNQIAGNAYTAPSLRLVDSGSNSIQLVGNPLVILPQCSNWCQVVLTTNQSTNAYALMIPFDTLSTTNRTNNASELVYGIETYSNNAFNTNTPALSNHMTLGVGPGGVIQKASTRKQFPAGLDAASVNFTNGYGTNLVLDVPITTNLVNEGNAIRSDGPGGNSFQAGSNAWALGTRNIAIGASALSTNDDSLAIGTGAVASGAPTGGSTAIGVSALATNQQATALGSAAQAQADSSTAIGAGAKCTTNSTVALGASARADGLNSTALGRGSLVTSAGTVGVAIGNGASVGDVFSTAIGGSTLANHSNAVALGYQATTTAPNQIRLGRSSEQVSVPGTLSVENGMTNGIFTGTNLWKGDISFPSFSVTTLAAGNNISVPFGTNAFIRLAAGGLASSPTICGIVGGATSGGRDGQEFVIFNDTGFNTVFAVNTVDPIPANRIEAQGGADVTVLNQGWIFIRWSVQNSRWKITSLYPASMATATNALPFANANATNFSAWANSSVTVPDTINPFVGSVTNGWQVLSSNGVPTAFVNSNSQFQVRGVTVASNYVNMLVQGSTNQNTNIFEIKDAGGNIDFSVNTNGAQLPYLPIAHVSTNNGSTDVYQLLGVNTIQATTTGTVLTNNNARAFPFYSGAGGNVDSLAINVATAVGASSVRFGIYNSIAPTNLYPGSLLVDCGQFDSSTLGPKVTNLVTTVRFQPGRVYWTVVEANAAVSVKAAGSAAAFPILGVNTNWTMNVAMELVSIGYGALPATCPLTNTILTSANLLTVVAAARFNGP